MDNMKKWILVVSMSFLCIGCTSNNEKMKVAVIVKSTTSQFFRSVQSGVNAASKEYNIEVSFTGSQVEEDFQTQIDLIHAAIKDEVDAIVLSAIDYNQLVEPVEKAIDAGIPVVVIDSDVNSEKVYARITTDNHEAGKMTSEAVLRQTREHISVGIVNFDAHTANGQEREAGFREALQDEERIRDIYTINVSSDEKLAKQGTLQLLKDHPDINTLVTFNEWTTLGVGYAVQEKNQLEDIFVVGFDNNPISVGMLETGEVDCLVVQNPFAMGYLGVEEALNAIKNKVHKEQDNLYTETVVIHKNNMFDKEVQKIVFPFN